MYTLATIAQIGQAPGESPMNVPTRVGIPDLRRPGAARTTGSDVTRPRFSIQTFAAFEPPCRIGEPGAPTPQEIDAVARPPGVIKNKGGDDVAASWLVQNGCTAVTTASLER